MATPYYKVFTGKTCFPEPESLNGTFSTVGAKVTIQNGDDTLKGGQYLYDSNQNEVRKVLFFEQDNPILESAFSVNIEVPIAIQVVGSDTYKSVSVDCYGGADGELNGENLSQGTIINYDDEDSIDPFVIDGTGTEIAISAL